MRALLDLLFPPRCPGCREILEGQGPFCRRCLESFADLSARRCDRCCEPEIDGLCTHCRSSPPAFEATYVPFLYGGALADAVHRFKYEDCPHYAEALASVTFEAAQAPLSWCTLVAPTSLHPRRLRSRGYDQALLLAKVLARRVGKRISARAIARVRDTAPQVGRDRSGREENVRGAFRGVPEKVRGERVLLVDDVLTTGATAHAAALALREAGAAGVRLFALARAAQ
jgi:ComF family protein